MRIIEKNAVSVIYVDCLCNKEPKIMNFDTLLVSHLGEFGTYQIMIILLVCSAGINTCLNDLDYIFSALTPPFRCNIPGLNQLAFNLSFDELHKLASPISTGGVADACLVYQYNYSHLTVEEARILIQSGNMAQFSTEKCKRWIYDKEESVTTIVTEWDLVCDKDWLVATSQSVYFAGLFTVFIGGILADRIGRKLVILGSLMLIIACHLLISLSPNIFVFMLGRFLLSSASVSLYTALCIFAIENVGPSKRTLAGLSVYFFWTVGHVILAGIAYFVQNWRIRNLIYIVFGVPYLLHFCFLPKSARWLKMRGRTQEAIDVVKLMSRVNKKELSSHILSDWSKSEGVHTITEEKPNLFLLFKSCMFVRITLITITIWLCVNSVFYGLIFYIPNLGGNIYISALISSVLEFAALIFVYLSLDTRLGRKYNTFLLFLVSGIMLILMIFIPADIAWLRISFAQIGRFAISAVFAILYISTAEIFPTRMRTISLSLCSCFSRIGSVVSPYLASLNKFGAFIPPLLFGGLSIFAALTYLLLPETKGKELHDFNIEAEEKKQSCNQNSGVDEFPKETDPLTKDMDKTNF